MDLVENGREAQKEQERGFCLTLLTTPVCVLIAEGKRRYVLGKVNPSQVKAPLPLPILVKM